MFAFGQQVILEADFEKERQRLIDELNPVFAKIRNADGSIKTILKSDKKAVRVFYENYYKYYLIDAQSVIIDTSIQIKISKQSQSSSLDKIKKLKIREYIFTYEEVEKHSWFFEHSQRNKKTILEIRKNVLDKENPIYTKIEILTKNGIEYNVILKSDSIAIDNFNKNKEDFHLVNTERFRIKKDTTVWVLQRAFKNCCCLPQDCIIWNLIAYPIDTTITIDVYKLKQQKKKSTLVPTYDFDHKKYTLDVRQKAIDAFNPIYAKIQTLTKNGIETELVLKRDSSKIEELHNNQDLFLYRSELVEIKTSGAYWIKRENSGCSCKGLEVVNGKCLTWVLIELPIDTVEVIKIYRSKKALKIYENDDLHIENVQLAKEAMQIEIDKLNPIYARVETIKEGEISTELILKHHIERIKTIQKNPDIYLLYDVEFIEINITSTYWKKVKPICVKQGKRNWIWVLDELPIQITEIIEIYRKQSAPKIEQKTVTTDITKSIKHINHNVFPNPFLEKITIEAALVLNKIVVFDQQGKSVFEQDLNTKTQTIDLSNLPQGIYYLKMIGEEFQETVKLIKQ